MKFILRRLLMIPPLVLAIATLGFFLVRLAPGGPFDAERAPASPEIERALRERYHLDESLPRQYWRFVSDLTRGDLGVSRVYVHHQVTEIVLQGLPATLSLGWLAFGVALGLGIPAGFLAAGARGGWLSGVQNCVTLAFICVPVFVIGPIFVLIFSLKLGWFPAGLWGSAKQAVLPVMTLGLFFAARVARLTREGVKQVFGSDYIRAARAKGLSENALLFRHALKPAIFPVVSYCGPMLADLLTGSFVVENIFQIPGIGVFLVNASLNRDYTMVVGLVMFYATVLLLLNLCVDVLYTLLDPRVRYE